MGFECPLLHGQRRFLDLRVRVWLEHQPKEDKRNLSGWFKDEEGAVKDFPSFREAEDAAKRTLPLPRSEFTYRVIEVGK